MVAEEEKWPRANIAKASVDPPLIFLSTFMFGVVMNADRIESKLRTTGSISAKEYSSVRM